VGRAAVARAAHSIEPGALVLVFQKKHAIYSGSADSEEASKADPLRKHLLFNGRNKYWSYPQSLESCV
jgi:hypothetical protein